MCLAFAHFTLNLIAQDDRAVITGTISDPSQADMPGVHLALNSKATGFHREAITNDAGVYVFPGLLVGNYQLTIRKDSFRTEDYESITLAVGQIRTINVQMQIATSATDVQVVADVAAVSQSSAAVSGVIGSTQVADIPINGRAWTSLMTLVPGAIDSGGGTQSSIRFAGRGRDDNNYRFDGVDASGIRAQSPDAKARLQISTEAIAEFKVDTALFSAETGGTAGGQVEIISKSGTNSLHGSAFEFIRNDALNSRGPFDKATLPPLRLNQFGGSLGGAIIKDRTFFFLAYEELEQRASTTLIGNVPSPAFRATALAKSPALAPILAAYPVGNQAFSADVSHYVSTGGISNSENSGMIRIDHRISDKTTFFARYGIDEVSLLSPSGQLLDKSFTNSAPMNGSMSLSEVLTPTMFNLVRLGVNRIRTPSGTDGHLYDTSKIHNSVQIPGFTTLAQGRTSVGAPTSYSLKDDFSWIHGKHTIQAGVEFKIVHYDYSVAGVNSLFYASRPNFIANVLDQIKIVGDVPMHGLHKWMAFGYVQDAWQLHPNFTVTVGVRYDFFNVFHEIYGRDLPFDVATCGGYCPKGSDFSFPVTNNVEPRLCLAWSPKFLHGRTTIRTGFGLFKGEGQLGDLIAPNDNWTQGATLTPASFPGLSFPADALYPLAEATQATPRGLTRDRRDPAVEQWGLQAQTALPAGFILNTGYMGYHGYHQFARASVNGLDPVTGLRQLPGFGAIDVKSATGNNHFHAMQASLQRRFRSGASFTLNYMWSHSINDGTAGGGEADYIQNVSCRTCDVASSDYDVRHVLSANSVYELPFGKGRRYLKNGKATNFAFGGWQLSGILSARSGNPVNPIVTRAASSLPDGIALQDGGVTTRPNYVGGVPIVPANQNINNWVNVAAFAMPANGTWGNAGRNIIRGPKFWQADLSLTKGFPLTERVILDFRADAFNAPNRPQFGDPSGDFSSPSFGKITTTVNNGAATGSGTPRQFQFALRLHF